MIYTIQDVIDSIIDGQHKQAVQQFIDGGFTFVELDQYNIASIPGVLAKFADRVLKHKTDEYNELRRHCDLAKDY